MKERRMKRNGIWGVLALVALIGCGGEDAILPTPVATATPPPACQIIVNGDNQGVIVCSGGVVITQPSPKPSPGSGPVVSLTINGMANGEHCPAGTPLANKSREICHNGYLDVTVNPRDANGEVIFDTTVTGVAPESFREVGDSPAADFVQDGGNRFNGRITCLGTGTIVLKAVVKGVPSPDESFLCQ